MTRTDPLYSLAIDTAPGRRQFYPERVICPWAVEHPHRLCADACSCGKPHRKLYTCNRDRRDPCGTCVPYTGKRKGKVRQYEHGRSLAEVIRRGMAQGRNKAGGV